MSDSNITTVNDPEKHLSVECFHKLNRARNVSFQMHLQIRQCEVNALPLLWVPDIFSYISEDISAVLEEAKALGLCDNFTGNARIGQVSL
ncbi:Derepression protein [Salmonella enterica subsp. enterica]|nr:Derepression protein [Salmonella enterica subsp. enterica]EEJ7380855.1 Derepression protein [Salmonella enterica subsp. enterica]